jgi:hypothetical protein
LMVAQAFSLQASASADAAELARLFIARQT